MNTQQLLAAQKKGAKIFHNGIEVAYKPRGKGDKKPWLYRGVLATYRYSAAQCQIGFEALAKEDQ